MQVDALEMVSNRKTIACGWLVFKCSEKTLTCSCSDGRASELVIERPLLSEHTDSDFPHVTVLKSHLDISCNSNQCSSNRDLVTIY